MSSQESRIELSPELLWERIAGCLHGLLVGDALGSIVAGWTQAQVEEEFGRLEDMLDLEGRYSWPRGLHSGSGQQALALIDSICLDPDQPEPHFIELMIALRDAAPQRAKRWGLHRGVGRNFRQAVRGLQAGAPPSRTLGHSLNHKGASAGNGAAARVAPIALWWRDDPATRDQRVAQLSTLTHTNLLAVVGAQTLAIAIAHSLVPIPGPVIGPRLVSAVDMAQTRASALLGRDLLGDQDDRRFSGLLRTIAEATKQGGTLSRTLLMIDRRCAVLTEQPIEPGSAFAPSSVTTALAIVDRCETFESALLTAVNLGGSADRLGAMVGALAGARHGLSSIPTHWLDALQATGALVDRVDRIQQRERGAATPALLGLEQGWDASFTS